jgi:hypothetical protein
MSLRGGGAACAPPHRHRLARAHSRFLGRDAGMGGGMGLSSELAAPCAPPCALPLPLRPPRRGPGASPLSRRPAKLRDELAAGAGAAGGAGAPKLRGLLGGGSGASMLLIVSGCRVKEPSRDECEVVEPAGEAGRASCCGADVPGGARNLTKRARQSCGALGGASGSMPVRNCAGTPGPRVCSNSCGALCVPRVAKPLEAMPTVGERRATLGTGTGSLLSAVAGRGEVGPPCAAGERLASREREERRLSHAIRNDESEARGEPRPGEAEHDGGRDEAGDDPGVVTPKGPLSSEQHENSPSERADS